jgi:hypothetical protein
LGRAPTFAFHFRRVQSTSAKEINVENPIKNSSDVPNHRYPASPWEGYSSYQRKCCHPKLGEIYRLECGDILVEFSASLCRNKAIAVLCCGRAEFRCDPEFMAYGINGSTPVWLVFKRELYKMYENKERCPEEKK